MALIAFAASASGSAPSFSGCWKSYATAIYLETGASDSLPVMGAVSNSLRLEASWRPARWCRLSGAYALAPRVQDPVLFGEGVMSAGFAPFGYRLDDLRAQLYPGPCDTTGSFAVLQDLDRLQLSLSPDLGDVYIGRQAISWGSARVINPTDFIAPWAFNELDTEKRAGVDAARARIPLGALSELDVGALFGEDFAARNSACYARGRFYLAGTDVSLIAADYRENLMIGLDLARALGGASGWLEAAWVGAGVFSEERPEDEDFVRASLGADYSWGGELYGFLEYHYSSAGATDRADYPGLAPSAAYQTGGVYLLGKHYICPGISWQATPLLNVAGQLLLNPADQSGYLMATADYSVAQNVWLQAGVFAGDALNRSDGRQPGPAERGGSEPEFECYPDVFFSSFGWYF
ncbi:hypothetical protein JW921_05050 [Candidatus Fermentibacterales bacterium]|nr:hypothetical protein [Candidatus Fermentibacterales bacterium]